MCHLVSLFQNPCGDSLLWAFCHETLWLVKQLKGPSLQVSRWLHGHRLCMKNIHWTCGRKYSGTWLWPHCKATVKIQIPIIEKVDATKITQVNSFLWPHFYVFWWTKLHGCFCHLLPLWPAKLAKVLSNAKGNKDGAMIRLFWGGRTKSMVTSPVRLWCCMVLIQLQESTLDRLWIHYHRPIDQLVSNGKA